jgi:hypothetical protein
VAFDARMNTTLVLATLIGLLGLTAPGMSWEDRFGDDPVPRTLGPGHREESRTASRKPPSPAAPDRKVTDSEAVESDDNDEDDEAPRLAFLEGLSSPRAARPPRRGVRVDGRPSHHEPVPIFLLCHRLDC